MEDRGTSMVNSEDAQFNVAGLELRTLTKKYGAVTALDSVSLTVEPGEFLTMLGPSGSGKSTILRLISGFTEPTSGQVFINGRDVSHMPPKERGIGMVFQNYALFPHLTSLENVAYGLKVRGWKKQARNEKASEVLRTVGLAGMENRLPREMSGGQQQRVALARALAFSPSLLLMDEPLGALDRELRIRMAGEIRRIHSELATTVVYVTHDREEALTLSDRIAIMKLGKIEAVDTPENLFTSPKSSFVGSFFGGHNILQATAVLPAEGEGRTQIRCEGTEISVRTTGPVAGKVALVVPGHAIQIAKTDSTSLILNVEVRESVYMGEFTKVVFSIFNGENKQFLQADVPGHHLQELSPGKKTELYIQVDRCVVVPWSDEQVAD